MRPPTTILIATRNQGKLREIRAILASLPIRIEGLDDVPGTASVPEIPEIEETGETLGENALIKARTVFGITGLPAMSDDSGLEVDFLGGAPGVRSARFAGESATYDDNNRKLLAMLASAGPDQRRARFRTVAAFAAPGLEHLTEGRCDGVIGTHPRGSNGFGYDPLFVPDGSLLTFAELSAETKNSISHRSRAFRSMGEFLQTLYRGTTS